MRNRRIQTSKRPVTQRDTMQVARHRLALCVMGVFAGIVVSAILFPDNALLDRLLPFIAAPLTVVLNYYFARRERG